MNFSVENKTFKFQFNWLRKRRPIYHLQCAVFSFQRIDAYFLLEVVWFYWGRDTTMQYTLRTIISGLWIEWFCKRFGTLWEQFIFVKVWNRFGRANLHKKFNWHVQSYGKWAQPQCRQNFHRSWRSKKNSISDFEFYLNANSPQTAE